MKIKPGRGKGSLGGGTPVIIRDDQGLLYGWKHLEKIYSTPGAEHEFYNVNGVELDVYMAFLDVNMAEARAAVANDPDKISTEQLRYVDARIEISRLQADALARLQRDENLGLIEEWHRRKDK